MDMKKIAYHEITGVIHCLSGVRIGGSDEQLQIGGTDLTCIKHPVTLRPYIPGSSIKGMLCLSMKSRTKRFNPTVVRLKDGYAMASVQRQASFNPTVVRFKE